MLLAICFLSYELIKKDEKIKGLNKSISELQQRANVADSLDAELFYTSVELNRFEIAFEIFTKRHPFYAQVYGDIISDETE